MEMVYTIKKHGSASCYLIAPDNVAAFIRRVTWAQGVVNCFCNIEEAIQAAAEPDFWSLEEIAEAHGCKFWTCEEVGA